LRPGCRRCTGSSCRCWLDQHYLQES